MKSKSHQVRDMVFGVHAVQELLKAKRRKVIAIYTTKPEPKAWPQLAAQLPKTLTVSYVSRDVLHNMAGTTDHQGLVALVAPFPVRSSFFDPAKQPFLLMLDGIQDPRNLGAILRSAYCIGADGIIITKRGSSPLSGTVFKASAGLAEYLDIFIAPSAAAAMVLLTKAGYQAYAAVLDKRAVDATTVTYVAPLCLIIGSEDKGVSADIAKQATPVILPQRRFDISYNASVAAGILLFLIAQQQKMIKR